MSTTVTKSAVRVGPLPGLTGVKPYYAMEALRTVFGEPDDVYRFGDEVESFSFENCEVMMSENGNWYVDMLIGDVVPDHDHPGLNISVVDMLKLADPLLSSFDMGTDRVMAYCNTWYNGVEEPDPDEVG